MVLQWEVQRATLKENKGVGSDVGGTQRMRETGPSCSEKFSELFVESNQITSSLRADILLSRPFIPLS